MCIIFFKFRQASNPNFQILVNFFRNNRFPTSAIDLLKVDGQIERAQYGLLGLPIGFLFNNFNEPISTPRDNDWICAWMPRTNRRIYDTWLNEWVPYTEELFNSIPKTCTFAPRPTDHEIEVEYFVRSAGLPKHVWIWSDGVQTMSRAIYLFIRGNINAEYRGRYTFTPRLPQIDGLGRWERDGPNDIYVIDTNDWEQLFLI